MGRSYGWLHQKRRNAMRKPNGDPCPFCWLPMWSTDRLHADHVLPRKVGGDLGPLRWAHKACNEQAGEVVSLAGHGIRSRQW